MTVADAETITEEAVEDLAEAVSQEDVKAEVLVDTEEILVVVIAKAEDTEEILVVETVKVVDTEEILMVEIVKEVVVSDQELHQLVQAIEDHRHQILAIAEEEAKGVHHLKDVRQKEEVLALIVQKELQEDQMTKFLV